jgi:hypothetical protein
MWTIGFACVSVCLQCAEAGPPDIAVEDTPVVVFEHSTRCEPMDLPDAPLRAFRRADGMVVAFATHYINRELVGPSLAALAHDCRVVYQGHHLADPAKFDDRTWIAATWTTDGVNVTALGHNEYQAQHFPAQCHYDECLYDAIVPLKSSDGGQSFFRTDYPQPIAAAPVKYNPEEAMLRGYRGYVNPTNIIYIAGYHYTLIGESGFGGKRAGRCLFRTPDITAPKSWTVWDGNGYVPIFGSPYDYDWKPNVPCESATGLSGPVGSIAKIEDMNIFAAFTLTTSPDNADGGYLDVSFSQDLLRWTDTKHLLNLTPAWSKVCPNGKSYNYPSALSNLDMGRNFETLGEISWLFIARLSCLHPLDRDLVRYPLTIRHDRAKFH